MVPHLKRGQILFRNICCHFPVLNLWELQYKTDQNNSNNSNSNNNSSNNNNTTTTNPQKIWIAETWIGYLVVFDPNSQRFTDFIEIPKWKTKGDFGSMVWDMEFDKKGK